MYNNPLKVPVLQEVSYCSYPANMRDYFVTSILDVIGFPYKEQQRNICEKK